MRYFLQIYKFFYNREARSLIRWLETAMAGVKKEAKTAESSDEVAFFQGQISVLDGVINKLKDDIGKGDS